MSASRDFSSASFVLTNSTIRPHIELINRGSAGPRGRPPCATAEGPSEEGAQAQIYIMHIQYGYWPVGLCDRSLRGQELSIKGAASNFSKFFDVSVWDSEICYSCRLLSKYFGCLSNPLNCTSNYSFSLKKFSKLKLLNNYLRSTISQESFAMYNIEKAILDTIDLNTVLMILHQETPFHEPMDIKEWKYMVIKLILEIQINYYFSLMFPDNYQTC